MQNKIFLTLWLFCTLLISQSTNAQSPSPLSADQLKLRLKKLNVLASVLYVAAHPDDENTLVIAYLNKEMLAETSYLSLTRGDGGQNLIGKEIRDALGVIRTQELLAARRLDGGKQFFSRANDFGFTKKYEEAFATWGKDAILSDVVTVYRKTKPDVVITRFPPDERAGHGHHTASAMLAIEAFDKSADPSYRTPGANDVWQPKRILNNTGRWWNPDINERSPGVITLDVGTYNPLLGESYAELAARSRSKHKSQGFGSTGKRGELLEFFELQKGDSAKENNLFDGVNTTWSRIKGGEQIAPLVLKSINSFDVEKPYASVPQLLIIRKRIRALAPSFWRDLKLQETEDLIRDCLGINLTASASHYYITPGGTVDLTVEIINRSPIAVKLDRIQSTELSYDTLCQADLPYNRLVTLSKKRKLSLTAPFSEPYWLRQPHPQGLFTVENPEWIGLSENLPAISVSARITIAGETLTFSAPVKYLWTDPVKGEQSRPVEVTPPVFISLDTNFLLYYDDQPKRCKIVVTAAVSARCQGTLHVQAPDGWHLSETAFTFDLHRAGEKATFYVNITPPSRDESILIEPFVEIYGKTYNRSVHSIEHEHIPTQTLLPPLSIKAVRLSLKRAGQTIAYIQGAGDDIPQALRAMGFDVWEMKDYEVTLANLQKVDAVVLSVRALNTNQQIASHMPDLLRYVYEGGTLVVQYNTEKDLKIDPDKFAPYPIELSRLRITEEDSPMKILRPTHPIFNTPNRITEKDFDHWLQERGLYFPSHWDSHYEALLSGADKGEKELLGALLVAPYGKGYYIYTGLSFFRQLPAGVEGAYKLFANIVSFNRQNKLTTACVEKK